MQGAGVIIAVIDSGIDLLHPDFWTNQGESRILALWDQQENRDNLEIEGKRFYAPKGYDRGIVFFNEDITQYAAKIPSIDTSGHGTHVAGIAAGNGRASRGRYVGVAPQADLLIVKIGRDTLTGFSRTTQIMEAVNWCMEFAKTRGQPIVINLSFGNNYGSHAGDSLLETYLDVMADSYICSIVTGTGNEGAERIHVGGTLRNDMRKEIPFVIGFGQAKMNLQLWKYYQDEFDIYLEFPNGSTRKIEALTEESILRIREADMEVLIYYGTPLPYRIYQEIYFDFIPNQENLMSGQYRIILEGKNIRDGAYELWLPSGELLGAESGFLFPNEEKTLTIPSTAGKVISVGAFDSNRKTVAAFSGRGYTAWEHSIKPDFVASGVDIISCAVGGGYISKSGTSMAAPFVSGKIALLMEEKILSGEDPYLYGDKMKARLILETKTYETGDEHPNPKMGWGVLE